MFDKDEPAGANKVVVNAALPLSVKIKEFTVPPPVKVSPAVNVLPEAAFTIP